MAQSSSSRSAASSRGGRRSQGVMALMQAPVPYRQGALEYEPPVLCHCSLKAPRWIAWSDDNPGRRYYRCSRARSGKDCGFFRWAEPEHEPFLKTLLGDLRDAVWKLKKEAADNEERLLQELDVWKDKNLVMEMELMQKMEELKAMQKQMEEKEGKMHELAVSANSRSHWMVLLVFVGFIAGLVVGYVRRG